MRRFLRSSITPILLCLLFANSAKGQSIDSTAEDSVRKAALDFVAAFNYLDWPRFEASFDVTATLFNPSGGVRRVEGRDSLVASFKRGLGAIASQRPGPPYLNIRPQDLLIQMLGDAAVVTFHLGNPPRISRRTLVFVRRGDRWLIAHLHASIVQVDTARADSVKNLR